MSSIPGTSAKLTPIYPPPSSPSSSSSAAPESPDTQTIISALGLEKHIEGGYFAEIDRNPLLIPNPFLTSSSSSSPSRDGKEEQEGRQTETEEEKVKRTAEKPLSGDDAVRNASTSIYYMLSRGSPQGHFHRNRGRTVCCIFLNVFSLSLSLCLFFAISGCIFQFF
jgi:hypothetical protein